MNRKEFMKALGAALYPSLREAGFKGSGATLRMIDDPVVHVFNVQGSMGGDGCYINLGIHLQHFPKGDGSPVDPAKITPTGCLIFQRFRPIQSWKEWQSRPDRAQSNPETWSYGSTPSELDASVQALTADWQDRGMRFFERLRNYPDDFHTLITDTDYAGYGERYDTYDLEHINFTALRRLAEHFDLPDELALIEAEATTFAGDRDAVRAALKKKLHGG